MHRLLNLFAVLLLALPATAQNDATAVAPYLQNPVMPAFRILLTDSTHWYTQADLHKGRPVMFMVFNPECEHCQKQAELISKEYKAILAGVEIVMASYQDLQKIRAFATTYNLNSNPNIHVGRDPNYFFSTQYNIHYFPFLVFYDKKGKLSKVHEGGATAEKLKDTVSGL